ncbi:MAG TPA: hypothetical protein DCZ01_13010 [Elusimicrobia bacterium]|nr:MAG: hypothetical protein A2X37_04410 [Elusimicrobia bacterium GWA2_66_18]OGR69913.1 MAG: hypothetical protein A2X40_10400 [Elusimicrobia bacterium GWC2_65_9]HAZ09402.1 hypothetical protein [Elusimicrobiota bacterium]
MKNSLSILFILLTAAPETRALTIRNSKHDLSAHSQTTGPKAVAEQDTCLFCHAAHKPAINSPLWNRADSPVQFTFYSSNYLNNYLGQTAPTMSDLNASKTKLCLSCHDGVTALGSVFNIAPNIVQMTGSMSAAAILGADLSNDHPVLYDVKPGAGPPTQPGTDPEIQLPAATDKVKVYGTTNRVECTSCHDPHDNQFGDFLVKSNANSALCTTCHQKTNFASSAHATSNAAYTPSGGAPTTVAEYSCRNCHRAHGASSAQAYILRGSEEDTCYNCHGSPALTGAKDIKTLLAKASKHPTETVAGVHKNPELDATNLGMSKRHAECWDCHNPHKAKTGTHASPGNNIGNVLLGAWGVEPTYGTASAWQAATSFVRQIFNDTTNYKEYQLCFKCHTYYAFGATPPAGYTDVSVEYNPYNRSAHPVRSTANAQAGSTAPKALAASQMSSPWNASANMGNQNMTCSDCHASDVTSDPKGVHGSASQYLLKGPRRYWPKNAAGTLWTLADVKNNANSWSTNLFCVNCHPLYVNGAFTNNVHERDDHRKTGVVCITCHVVVPHGSKRSRLIGYKSDPTPYNYGGARTYDKLVIEGFRKALSRTGYDKDNCNSKATGCHTGSGTFEP